MLTGPENFSLSVPVSSACRYCTKAPATFDLAITYSVPLEESIAIYERGEALKLRCEGLLRQAEARIERITLTADGRPSGTTPLDEE